MLHVTYIKLVEYASYVEYSVKKIKKNSKFMNEQKNWNLLI